MTTVVGANNLSAPSKLSKSTPLAATITVFDVYGVGGMVRQETYRIYEPLLLVAGIYICLSGIIILFFRWFERRNLQRQLSTR